MGLFGRIRRRLALAIVLTALIPMLVSIVFAEYLVRETSARFYQPEVRPHLDQALDVYQDLAREKKARMRATATALSRAPGVRSAAMAAERRQLEKLLGQAARGESDLMSLTVTNADGDTLAGWDRGRPLDPDKELSLEVRRTLGDDGELEEAPELVALFATSSARFQERDKLSVFVDTFGRVERRRQGDDSSRLYAFAVMLGFTIILAIAVGTLLARGVSTRIGHLARATGKVAEGDLDVRVPEVGTDEVSDLAKGFNRMLSEVSNSRARIEYLQRIGAWQEMARRLAHEIKNPLTPIQLAVQEVHRRYPGDDPRYRGLLDTTLEIVEDEVGTLRRLVSEFSHFARLPHAELQEADLAEFIREQRRRLSPVEGEEDEGDRSSGPGLGGLDGELTLELPEHAYARIDQQMLRRALINLVRNAAQASEGGKAPSTVRVRLEQLGESWALDIEDDGPGIPEELRETIFDPYVTTKTDGTGLGLAIVKKIVMEHGGSISADASDLGGARIRLLLPVVAPSEPSTTVSQKRI